MKIKIDMMPDRLNRPSTGSWKNKFTPPPIHLGYNQEDMIKACGLGFGCGAVACLTLILMFA